MKHNLFKIFICAFMLSFSSVCLFAKHENFKVAVYVRAYEVQKMSDSNWLDSTWTIISQQLDVDKIYLETHRDLLLVDDATLNKAKSYFQKKGIEVAGGITYTINEANDFETFSYSDPNDRAMIQRIAEHTAKHFDEFILDDFFFTSSKKDVEIAAKGSKTWTQYRLELMNEAGKNLVVDPAKKVNPKVKVIIKYPNWYDHFQGLGFNLEDGPQIFDGVWTGTETRDPSGAQHLQNYLSYNVMRYFENISNGRNGGGWVDSGGINMSMDRYAEQLHLTAIAKSREIMLFAYNQLIGVGLSPNYRAPWQGTGTSWNYDEMTAAFKKGNQTIIPTTMARIADVTLRKADELVGKLGNPIGIKSFKAFHTQGEEFLQNYLGMIGLPMDMYSTFANDQKLILLTQQASGDPYLIDKIKAQLQRGGSVAITTGLLKTIPEKIAEVCELRCSDLKAIVNDFGRHGQSSKDILIPQVSYYTNDSWEMISAGRPLSGGVSGYPILHRAQYSNGTLYVLTVPDDFGNLYDYPEGALNEIRRTLSADLDFYFEGPSKVSLFMYDNKTLIIENFNDEAVDVKLVGNEDIKTITLLDDNSTIEAEQNNTSANGRFFTTSSSKFPLTIPAHSYIAVQY